MKSEPLKDKKHDQRFSTEWWFREKDVKSAVEWLKEDIEKMFEKEYIEGKKDKSCKKIIRKINKAFEDVIKK